MKRSLLLIVALAVIGVAGLAANRWLHRPGVASVAPGGAVIVVDAASTLRLLDPRFGGVNTLAWDPKLGSDTHLQKLQEAGVGSLRYPGGSMSDIYRWDQNGILGQKELMDSGSAVFARTAERAGSEVYITFNYGSGTPQQAAAWVAWANGSPESTQALGTDSRGIDWKTVGYWASLRAAAPVAADDGLNHLRAAHPAPYGWRHFEIGNEVYGGWEHDEHGKQGSGLAGKPWDPVTYAQQAAEFIASVRAVDPQARLGIVVSADPGQGDDQCTKVCDSSLAVPSRRGGRHHGWTAVVLYRLAQTGQRPDFLALHYYAQQPGKENDARLLDGGSAWPTMAQQLRRQIDDYWTAAGGDAIELALTEFNSVASNPGKQSVGLVNALFFADTYGQLAATEIKATQWWCLTATEDVGNNMSSALHGRAAFGSYAWLSRGVSPPGVKVPPQGAPFPTYQVARQLAPWREAGSAVLRTTSGHSLLAAYATRQPDGTLSLLVINKSPVTALDSEIELRGFVPAAGAVGVSTYGLPEEARDVAPTPSTLPAAAARFSYSFPAYSSTLMRFAPASR